MNSKSIILSLLLSCITSLLMAQKSGSEMARLFLHHFRILDSIAIASENDTLINCMPSIQFMEDYTGIEASTDGTYIGRLACTKKDLAKWLKWYRENSANKPKKKKLIP